MRGRTERSVKLLQFLNRYKLVKSYLAKKTEAGGYPCELVVELTNRCNLDCVMCPRDKMLRPVGDMSFDLFAKIVDEIKNRVEMVDLCFAGESLLHPEVFAMIKYAKKNGLKVFLQSNATTMDERIARELVCSKMDLLVLSIDAVTGGTYKQIRRGGNFNEVVKNVATFLKMKKRNGNLPYTIVQMIYLIQNKHEVKEFIKFWKEKGADAIRIKPFNTRAGFVDNSLDGRGRNIQSKSGFPCIHLWRGLAVYWDGRVVPCCMDYSEKYILGDLHSQSILEIWNSPRIKYLRQLHISGEIKASDLCRNCSGYKESLPKVLGSLFFNALVIRKLTPIWNQAEANAVRSGTSCYDTSNGAN